MKYIREALVRMLGMFGGASRDGDVRQEMQTHLEMETAENIRRGMAPDEARRQALLTAGGVTQAAEAVRDQRGLPWLEAIAADLKYAVRALSHSRAFTVIVVLTLALGIGANTAIFSVVRGVVLKPLPQRASSRLVYLRHEMDGPGGDNILFSVPEVRDYRAGANAFGEIAEYCPWTATLQTADGAERIDVGLVSGNYFDVIGLSPVLGRLTRSSDDGPGVPPVMVMTNQFWHKRFGGDPNIVGKTLKVDGQVVTVVGVVEPAPFYPYKIDAVTNMVLSQHHVSAQMVLGRTHRMTEVLARLAPGATMDQARTQVASVDARVQRQFPEFYAPATHYRVTMIPFKDAMSEKAQLTLWLLIGVAAFVLIISAASVTNLTLMRGVRREPELVTRAALGSGVARLRRLLLAENLLLTLMGAALGVVMALGGVRLLSTLAARYSVRADEIRLDASVFGFTLALSVLVALLLSFVAFIPREGRLASIVGGTRRSSGGVRKQRLQRGLVVAQIAVSVVLLAGAGLLTRTMLQLSRVRTGLKTEQVLTMAVHLESFYGGDFKKMIEHDAETKDNYDRLRRAMLGLPGAVDAGIGSDMPLRASTGALNVRAEGKSLPAGQEWPFASFRSADPTFFSAAGIPIIRGRAFTAGDRRGSGLVVIVNETLAEKLFPGEDPIGKRVAWTGDVLRFTPFTADWRTIVGVVGNTQDGGMDAAPRLAMYEPFAQEVTFGAGIAVRSDSNVANLEAAATRLVHQMFPAAPVENVLTISQIKDESIAPRRLNAELVSSFGALAAIIAAVGIAGVLAFSVSARTNEIGIRMSLGADRGRVQRMVLSEGGVLVVLGLALGVGGAYVASGLIHGLLFGVAPHDPMTFAGVALAMAAIGVVACWIPALRASRVDPAITIRSV